MDKGNINIWCTPFRIVGFVPETKFYCKWAAINAASTLKISIFTRFLFLFCFLLRNAVCDRWYINQIDLWGKQKMFEYSTQLMHIFICPYVNDISSSKILTGLIDVGQDIFLNVFHCKCMESNINRSVITSLSNKTKVLRPRSNLLCVIEIDAVNFFR